MSAGPTEEHGALEAQVREAEELCRNERWCEALDRYGQIVHQRVIRLRDGVGAVEFAAADVVIIERLAELSVLCGFSSAADDLLAAIHSLYSKAANLLPADCLTLKRLHLAISLGELERAMQLLESLEATTGSFDQIEFTPAELVRWESRCSWSHESYADRAYFFAQFHLQAGRLLAAHGQYRQALAAFARGLHHAADRTSPARHAALPLRVEHAAALLELGELASARSAVAALSDEFAASPHPGAGMRVLELSGQLHLLRGELGSALMDFEQVVESCASLGLERAAAVAKLNLAQIFIFLNRTTDARTMLLGLLETADKFGADSIGIRAAHLIVVAGARSGAREGVRDAQAVIEMWDGEQARPCDDLEHAHRLLDLPQAGNFLEFFEDRALSFHSLLDTGDFATGHQWLEEMREVFNSTDSALIQIRLRVLQAIDAYFVGATEHSARECTILRPELQRLGLKRDLWQVVRLSRWCEARLSPDRRSHDEALRTEGSRLLSEMADSLPRGDRAVYLLNKATDEEEEFTARIDELEARMHARRQMAAPLRWLDRLRVANKLYQLLVAIDGHRDALVSRQLRGESHEGSTAPRRPLWKELLLHPLRRATISFLVLPDRVFSVRASWMKLDFRVRFTPRLGVRESVAAWHRRMASEQSAATAERIATRLANDLGLAEIMRSLPRWIRSVTIVPDDCLHGFPFPAVLRTDRTPEGYALAIGFARTRQPHRAPARHKTALVAATSAGAGNLPPLPNTLIEARTTAEWLIQHGTATRLFLNAEARKATVIEHLASAGFVHLACHGEFHPDDIDRTGLALIPRSGEKELITLRELAALDLTGLEHITLAACWSADNYILPGRWIVSLPETLWRAGAGAILASLWKVDDAVSAAFVRCFYEHSLQFPRDEALRLTQRACLDRKLPGAKNYRTEDPYFWAGYVLYGGISRMAIQQ
ncbi:MAG TPA: CHAT domain-containing protein [Chthoniobacterales bacterium]|nr:CHAT domain-containing protein [Chthoniobacterales bacterium]